MLELSTNSDMLPIYILTHQSDTQALAHLLVDIPTAKLISQVPATASILIVDPNYTENTHLLDQVVAGSIIMLDVLSAPLYKQVPDQVVRQDLVIIGCATWSGALAQEAWELSCLDHDMKPSVEAAAAQLGKTINWVEDEVALVSPRVISMVINEAFFTLEEGTANEADIDKSMRLGVNYPKGPFEWAAQLGLHTVLNVLDSLWAHTHDPRYKAALLLRRRAARQ